jgi:multidrug efflux pump subunit AcrB
MFDFFYKRGYLTTAIILGLFVFGVIGLVKMPKNLFPDANRPEVVIFTTVPGAPANVLTSLESRSGSGT